MEEGLGAVVEGTPYFEGGSGFGTLDSFSTPPDHDSSSMPQIHDIDRQQRRRIERQTTGKENRAPLLLSTPPWGSTDSISQTDVGDEVADVFDEIPFLFLFMFLRD
ncbi:unnamed protein product [Linum trigynum]|uniref:Uncharacterized protein n=1 Tax=Linum trigynum TaxID=586398 RepID=A0AAV2FBK4_9ROSI